MGKKIVKEYLLFEEVKLINKKTPTWFVHSKKDHEPLGEIKWYPQWRQYCFFPFQDTFYNKGCLNQIIQFIQNEMNKRKDK